MYVNKTIKPKRYNQRWGQFSPDLLQFQSKSQCICKFWNCMNCKSKRKADYLWVGTWTCPIKNKATECLTAVRISTGIVTLLAQNRDLQTCPWLHGHLVRDKKGKSGLLKSLNKSRENWLSIWREKQSEVIYLTYTIHKNKCHSN